MFWWANGLQGQGGSPCGTLARTYQFRYSNSSFSADVLHCHSFRKLPLCATQTKTIEEDSKELQGNTSVTGVISDLKSLLSGSNRVNEKKACEGSVHYVRSVPKVRLLPM